MKKEVKSERQMAFEALVAIRLDPTWHTHLDEDTKNKVANAISYMEINNMKG
jgi:hypothetical protein